MKNVYQIGSGDLTFDIIERIINENLKLELAPEAKDRIQKCRDYLDKRSRNPMSLSMASRQDSAACATIIFLPMN